MRKITIAFVLVLGTLISVAQPHSPTLADSLQLQKLLSSYEQTGVSMTYKNAPTIRHDIYWNKGRKSCFIPSWSPQRAKWLFEPVTLLVPVSRSVTRKNWLPNEN